MWRSPPWRASAPTRRPRAPPSPPRRRPRSRPRRREGARRAPPPPRSRPEVRARSAREPASSGGCEALRRGYATGGPRRRPHDSPTSASGRSQRAEPVVPVGTRPSAELSPRRARRARGRAARDVVRGRHEPPQSLGQDLLLRLALRLRHRPPGARGLHPGGRERRSVRERGPGLAAAGARRAPTSALLRRASLARKTRRCERASAGSPCPPSRAPRGAKRTPRARRSAAEAARASSGTMREGGRSARSVHPWTSQATTGEHHAW